MAGPFSGLCKKCEKHSDLYGEKVKELTLLYSLGLKHDKCAKVLIKTGADLNWLLLNALKNRDVESVDLLIQEGADVNKRDQQWEYPIHIAVAYGNTKCVDILIQAGADVNLCHTRPAALIPAAEQGLYEIVDLLIKGGANVNMTDDTESTALTLASKYSHGKIAPGPSQKDLIKCIETLIKAGADVNHANRDCITPLIHASEVGFCEAMRLLLQAGAEVNTANSVFSTPLIEAAAFGQWECMKSIFLGGIRPSTVHRRQVKTAERKYLRCGKLLLRFGANIGEISSRMFLNSLENHIDLLHPHESEEMCVLLHAAGETMHFDPDKFPNCLKFKHLRLCLKHLSRERIRTHLLRVNRRENLFGRVQRLGLPHLLTKYLVYDLSLDDDDDDDDQDRS